MKSKLIIFAVVAAITSTASAAYLWKGLCPNSSHAFYGIPYKTQKECMAAAEMHKREYGHSAWCKVAY